MRKLIACMVVLVGAGVYAAVSPAGVDRDPCTELREELRELEASQIMVLEILGLNLEDALFELSREDADKKLVIGHVSTAHGFYSHVLTLDKQIKELEKVIDEVCP